MAGAFPINWRTGGIAWERFNGVFSLYVCLRFGVVDERKAFGFIIRVGPQYRALYRARKKRWLLGRLQVGAY